MYKLAVPNLFLGLVFCASSALSAAETSPVEELEALRQDIGALKESQQAIGRDVAEIRKLLQAMQPPPPVRPIDAVLDIGSSPLKGQKDAKLTLVEFSDYQCPFCRRHAETTLPQLDRDYIATGKVRYVFRDFPLESIHAQAPKAAEAAHCAGEQGRYWDMHDKLFANQQALAPENLAEHAQAIGLELEPFKACVDGGKYAQRVRKDIAEGEKLGMSGTPTMLLGLSNGDRVKLLRLMVGAQPFALFKAEIDKLLAEPPDSK